MALHEKWQHTYSLDEVAKKLHVYKDVVLELQRMGKFIAERGPTVDGYARWRFLEREVAALRAEIEQVTWPNQFNTFGEPLDLADAAKKLGPFGFGAAHLLAAVCRREVDAQFIDGEGKLVGCIKI